jgi:hypothetical protein
MHHRDDTSDWDTKLMEILWSGNTQRLKRQHGFDTLSQSMNVESSSVVRAAKPEDESRCPILD